MTTWTNTTKNSASYTNPNRSDYVEDSKARFGRAKFSKARFAKEDDFTFWTRPTKHTTSYEYANKN